MSLRSYVRAGLRYPPAVAVRKAAALAYRLARQRRSRWYALRSPTFAPTAVPVELRRRIRLDGSLFSAEAYERASRCTSYYLDHLFDLLGSGWVQVRHGMTCAGLEGYCFPAGPPVQADPEGEWLRGRVSEANLPESRRIWSLVEPPYTPIDWQLDFKSGHRWSELTYFLDIRYGKRRGADIKVPWELARLQHLPQLALAYRREQVTSGGAATRYMQEFRNQILDFIATNPPQFGVNWGCAMEVALRIANILAALDLFVDAGAQFDAPFLQLVARSSIEHGRHVFENLEWSDQYRGNHYLADIVGLLFVSCYLPRCPLADTWLRFAAGEFIGEATEQFLPDGGNIEGSTSYHRLSGELILFGSALLLGLDEAELAAFLTPPAIETGYPHRLRPLKVRPLSDGRISALPEKVLETLVAAGELTRDVTKPSGEVVQWGDNDSGRLFKYSPSWALSVVVSDQLDEAATTAAIRPPRENHLDHRSFVAGVAALSGRRDLANWAGSWMEATVAYALAGGRKIKITARPPDPPRPRIALPAYHKFANRQHDPSIRVTKFCVPSGALVGLRTVAYPYFGHYAIIGERFFLAIRCPHNDGGRAAGHMHDDALSMELQVDNYDLIRDPGTFVYTPLPEERNQYRAAGAHFAPRILEKPSADFSNGLFEIDLLAYCRCNAFGPNGFAGEIRGNGWSIRRVVVLGEDHVMVFDEAVPGPLAPLPAQSSLPRACIGYGIKTDCSPRIV